MACKVALAPPLPLPSSPVPLIFSLPAPPHTTIILVFAPSVALPHAAGLSLSELGQSLEARRESELADFQAIDEAVLGWLWRELLQPRLGLTFFSLKVRRHCPRPLQDVQRATERGCAGGAD